MNLATARTTKLPCSPRSPWVLPSMDDPDLGTRGKTSIPPISLSSGLRHQHGLGDLAGVHGGKCLPPLVKLPPAANNRVKVQLAGGQQLNHPLPDRPVVA